MVIDFTDKKLLKETWSETLGSWSKTILRWMYGDDVQIVAKVNEEEASGPRFIIRGKQKDVKAYATAIVKEKEYLDAYTEYGKNHLQTNKARARLNIAVKQFERTTGLTWPFKDEG